MASVATGHTGWATPNARRSFRIILALGLGLVAMALSGCGSAQTASPAADDTTAEVQEQDPAIKAKPRSVPRAAPKPVEPVGFTGVFSTMDALQRCKATDEAVVCASIGSGQRVRLDQSGARYEGEVATSFPAAAPLGLGNEVTTESGITCANTRRGIECNRGGHGFVIGDSAVVVLRGSDEQRFEPTPPEDEGEETPTLTVEPPVEETAPSTAASGQVCWPDVVIPPTTIPAIEVGGTYLPAQTLPGQTIPGTCFDSAAAAYLPPVDTTVLADGYAAIDPDFSPELSEAYWDSVPVAPATSSSGYSGSYVPDFTAPGFGELNEAGFPKNQYVRPYLRRDGTSVTGHWRNSPSDGLPTCSIIDC